MTNQQILEKAINRAIAGGWQSPSQDLVFSTARQFGRSTMAGYYVNGIIFNKEFAKALWGNEKDWNTAECEIDDGTGYSGYLVPLWQGMLQQMVIADDPIKYLGENL